MTDNVVIPKIIMQTWKTHEVPEHWKSSPESIKKKMPDWEYVLMSDEDNLNFVKEHFPDFVDTYENLEYNIMRADAIRYMWLYVHGGIYMDLDIMLRKDMSPLFTEDTGDIFLIRSGNIKGYYTNSFMASKPGNPFWLTCIDEMKQKYRFWMIGKHFKVMGKTGPMMVSRAVKKTKSNLNIKDLPSKLIMSCSICDAKPCQLKDSYCINLEGSSWIAWDTKMYNYCMCNWQRIVIIILIIAIVLILLRRNLRIQPR